MAETRNDAGRDGDRRGGRLKGVRRRKRARRLFACEVMAWKMRLVRIKSDEGRGD